MIDNPFLHATKLTESLYDSAAIHLVAERRGQEWANLYTSVIYGRKQDFQSVPATVDFKRYSGQTILCLRVRIARATVDEFLSTAKSGRGYLKPWTVTYDLEPAITGFRPATSFNEMIDKSFWETSIWTREHIGTRKDFSGHRLEQATAWRLPECLGCLTEARWAPIPLLRHPEKLNDLDEIWPSPVALESRARDNLLELEITKDFLRLPGERFTITGSLLRRDLVVRAISLTGKGPHRLEVEADGVDLLACVDGVPLDGQAFLYLKQLTMSVGIGEGNRYTVPRSRRRPEMTFPIGFDRATVSKIGTDQAPSVRAKAWSIGRWFRNESQAQDAEHVYDLQSNPDSVQEAFQHLQEYGRDQYRPAILIADPYALDERALHAIATIAVRDGRASAIRVVTAFEPGMDKHLKPPGLETWWRWILQWCRPVPVNRRALEEERAVAIAQQVAKRLNVEITFFRATSLHDRFLIIGNRIWHVGTSFNSLGEEISAIVEMRSEMKKERVRSILERFTSQPPVFEVKP